MHRIGIKHTTSKTSKKPQKKGGKGKLRGAKDGVPFGQQPQPSPDAKKEGWARKKFNRALIKELINLPYNFSTKSRIKTKLQEAFDIDVNGLNNGTIMTLQQIQKAIVKSDTNSFRELINQTEGLPKQQTELSGEITVSKKVIRFKNAE